MHFLALHMNISRENFPMRACALDELKGRYPGRSRECERLFSLLGEPGIAIPLYLYGPSGCGKSAVLSGVLEALEIRTAFVDCVTHPTPQSIFESALNQLAGHRPQASNGYSCWSSCDSPAAFVAGLRQLVAVRKRVCLVFDKAERLSARGGGLMQVLIALPSLCAAAAAASVAAGAAEDHTAAGAVLPVFVGEALWADFQHACDGEPRVLQFRFGGYSMAGLKTVLKRDVHEVLPAQSALRKRICARAAAASAAASAADEGDVGGDGNGCGAGAAAKASSSTALAASQAAVSSSESASGSCNAERPVYADAFEAFVDTVVDLFSEICRDTHELRHICRQLFPLYVKPVADGVLLGTAGGAAGGAAAGGNAARDQPFNELGVARQRRAAGSASADDAPDRPFELRDTRQLHAAIQPHLKRAMRRVYARDGLHADADDAALAAAVAGSGSALQLPVGAQWLLLAGFLASRLPPRADLVLFSSVAKKPGRRGGGPRKTKLLDTSHPFTLDRLLAIYSSIALEEHLGGPAARLAAAPIAHGGAGAVARATADGRVSARPPVRAELLVQAAGLLDLRLFSRVTKEGHIDAPRFRCEAAEADVESVARLLKFDLQQYRDE